jgi:glycosyl transferase family 87
VQADGVSPADRDPRSRLAPGDVWLLLCALGTLVLVGVPMLGSEPWDFRPGTVHPAGPFAAFVRGAHRAWDPEAIRAPALLGGVLVAAGIAVALVRPRWSRLPAIALTVLVVCLLVAPGVVLQAGLRQSSAPWFFTNDSTYQIELAGKLLRNGQNPYGHDYSHSGLERFYSLDGSVTGKTRREQVALRHFAYFPGSALTATAWTALPRPWSDYRFFVLLTTVAGVAAALAFPGPLGRRLALGAVVAANPLALRAAWFGTADAPSVVCTVLAFALVARRRLLWAAVALAVAVLLKQFALVAVPFLAVAAAQRASRRDVWRAGAVFAAIVAAGILPFVVWDAGAFWADTIEYGGRTYRIVGYGLSGLLVKLKLIHHRTDPYPFLPLLALVWLPLSVWLLWAQRRSRELWTAAAGFAVSIFALVFLGRVFQGSYLVWPLVGTATAAFLAATRDPVPARVHSTTRRPARRPPARRARR